MHFSKTRVIMAVTAVMVVAWASVASGANGNAIRAGQTTTATAQTTLSTTQGSGAGFQVNVAGATTGAALKGQNNAKGPGLAAVAKAPNTFGVNSQSTTTTHGTGAAGFFSGGQNDGLRATTANNASFGIKGFYTGATHGTGGAGFFGGGQNDGVRGTTVNANSFGALFQNATSGAGTVGVGLVALGRGHTLADNGIGGDTFSAGIEASGPNGVEGNSHTPGGFGVSGDAPAVGVRGAATAAGGIGGSFTGGTDGTGVNAAGSGTGNGVNAFGGATGVNTSGTSFGVDSNVAASGAVAIRGTAGVDSNDAVQGNTSNGVGDAVQGITNGAAAFALFAIASASTAPGVVSSTSGGTGVSVDSASGVGVSAANGSSINPTVFARNATASGTAGNFIGDVALNVENNGTFGVGVNARVTGDTNGDGDASNDGNDAIYAQSDDTNNDAVITAQTAAGSTELSHEAIETFGFLDVNGNARVVGNLNVTGTCCGPLIDNPLDPANSYLRHTSVSSSEMKNMYDGVVTTDARGLATVRMPRWFPALNKSFRYQLTVIGRSFAQAIIWKELAKGGRTFQIRTNLPHVKVSWQVTGIRNDAWAKANPFKVIQSKGQTAGQYLYPALFGQPKATPLGLDLPNPPSTHSAAAVRSQDALQRLIQRKVAQALKEYRQAQRAAGHSSAPKPATQKG